MEHNMEDNTEILNRIIDYALWEDVGYGDHTSRAIIPAEARIKMQCLAKENGVLAGVGFARILYDRSDVAADFSPLMQDGDAAEPGQIVFEVEGNARALLATERLVLNVMQRMSGIAGRTREVADAIAHTKCKPLDTRKTTPLIRYLEKWAVRIGGGVNHRMGLYDMILIKDNHIDYAGGVTEALSAAEHYQIANGLTLPVVVETRNHEEIAAAVEHQSKPRILLDNMKPREIKDVMKKFGGQAVFEASGNITLKTAARYAETGVDFISMGSLTHSVKSMDLSLKIVSG